MNDLHSNSPEILVQTYELGQATLRLRTDLKFTLQQDKSSNWFLVEDESRGNFFRIGVTEYAFLSLLDGRRTLDEALAKLASLSCCDDLSDSQAASLARWVVESGLAETATSNSFDKILHRRQQVETSKSLQRLNPIAIRIPLFNPDAILTRIYGMTRFAFGFPTLLIWCIVCALGMITLAMIWDDFWNHQISAFTPFDFLWLGASWFVLKIFHEGAHGLACKHYGGRVPQFGILLLLLIPLPFIDVSSSWRFTSKTQRIMTSAAGMLAEIFLASIAIIVWSYASPGPLRFHLGNLIIAATVHTLLFNANPLMKFDGYYMLLDAIEIPNLYTRGRNFVKSFAKWVFFGVPYPSDSDSTHGKIRIVQFYGIASMVWLALITLGLSAAALNLFSGIGLLIASLAALVWVGIPLVQLAKYLIRRHETERPSRLRFASVIAGLIACTAMVTLYAPSPETIRAPVVIVGNQDLLVRSRAAGFVESIHVRTGSEVEAGQALISMRNPQLEADIAKLKIDIESSRVRASIFRSESDLATWQMENETLTGLEKQLRELMEKQSDLTVVAPINGTVESSDLEELDGVYLTSGQVIARIGDRRIPMAIAMVMQSDAAWVRNLAGDNPSSIHAKVYLWGSQSDGFAARLKSISPKATDRVPHFAFASVYGGPLAVLDRNRVESVLTEGDSEMQQRFANTRQIRHRSLVNFGAARSEGASDELKLTQQFVPIEVEFDGGEQVGERYASMDANAGWNVLERKTSAGSQKKWPGQTGYVLIRARHQSLGEYIWQNGRQWIAEKIQLNHGL